MRGRLLAAGRLLCLLFGGSLADGAPLPCAGRLSLHHADRIFDGARLSIVLLRGDGVTLATDTLGAWIPLDEPTPEAGITFRHRLLNETKLSICVVPRDKAPAGDAGWERYVHALCAAASCPAEILESRDSGRNIDAIATLGMPTREVLLRRSRAGGGPTTMEKQVLAIDAQSAFLFSVAGPDSTMERATADLRFLLARLERL